VSKNRRLRRLVVQPVSSRNLAGLLAIFPGRNKLLSWRCSGISGDLISHATVEGLGFWGRLETSCRGGGVTPRGACAFLPADFAVRRLLNLLRGGIENTGDEWLIQPTCRPGGRSARSRMGVRRGGRHCVLPWAFIGGPLDVGASAGRRSLTLGEVGDSVSGSVLVFHTPNRGGVLYQVTVLVARQAHGQCQAGLEEPRRRPVQLACRSFVRPSMPPSSPWLPLDFPH